MVKQWLKQTLFRLGYDVVRVSKDGWQTYNLEKLGFRPRTVVDVGVGMGTPALYQTYPDAYHVLVDPLVEFEPAMQRVLQRYKGMYCLTALGAAETQRTLLVNSIYRERSSLHPRTVPEEGDGPLIERIVPVTTLDTLLARHGFSPPFGLKLDVEGSELEVIAGAPQFLRDTEFVIAELPIKRRFVGGYTLLDFIQTMTAHQFSLCEVLDLARFDETGLVFIDAVFRRETSTDSNPPAGCHPTPSNLELQPAGGYGF